MIKGSIFKNIFYFLFIPVFLLEILLFKFFKKQNSHRTYQMMIFLFGKFGGKFNKILSNFLCVKKNINLDKLETYIENNKKPEQILKELNTDGYSVIKNIISKEMIKVLKDSIIKTPGVYSSDEFPPESNLTKEFFDIENPKGVRFVYSGTDLLKNSIIQNLDFDKFFINSAKNYLGCVPVLDIVGAWWSSPSEKPDYTAAQFWHHDMDRPKWLKIFIYLTDCGEKNGPHEFITGSHKNNGIPKNLRSKGYIRLDDEIISKYYSKNHIKKFTANEGDLILEDTIGLHKGKQLLEGRRLMLNFQYSSCSFGASLPELKFPEKIGDNLSNIKINFPDISSKLIG